MSRRYQPWSVQDEAALALLAFLGYEQLAVVFDRTPNCVKRKASRLGVSVKRKSEINVTAMSPAAIERLRDRAPGLLCPVCGRRLAVDKLGGVCAVCHKQALTQAHLDKLAEVEAQRALWRARQNLTRERKRLVRDSGGEAASV